MLFYNAALLLRHFMLSKPVRLSMVKTAWTYILFGVCFFLMWFWSRELIFHFTIFLENSIYLYKHIFLLKPLVHNCVGTTFLSKFHSMHWMQNFYLCKNKTNALEMFKINRVIFSLIVLMCLQLLCDFFLNDIYSNFMYTFPFLHQDESCKVHELLITF